MLFSGRDHVEMLRESVALPPRGHVLIETRCSLISSGTEQTCLQRHFSPRSHWADWVQYPFRPGFSTVGVVEAVGRGVNTLAPGDRVASHAPHAQYVTVPAADATPVPEGISDEDAAWFAIAGIAEIGMRAAGVAAGDAVVVIGVGIIGQMTVQYSRLAGASKVIAIARSGPRLAAAAAHGATDVVERPADEAVTEIHRLTNRDGAHVVLDVTGSAKVLPHALRMARRRGTVVILGDTGYPEDQHLTPDLILKGLRVVGAHFDHADTAEHGQMARGFFAALERGDLGVGDLITHRIDAHQAPKAYAALSAKSETTLGVVFDWTGTGH